MSALKGIVLSILITIINFTNNLLHFLGVNDSLFDKSNEFYVDYISPLLPDLRHYVSLTYYFFPKAMILACLSVAGGLLVFRIIVAIKKLIFF